MQSLAVCRDIETETTDKQQARHLIDALDSTLNDDDVVLRPSFLGAPLPIISFTASDGLPRGAGDKRLR